MKIKGKEYIYLRMHTNEHFIISSGWSTSNFMKLISKRIKNILLLQDNLDDELVSFHNLTKFNYIEEEALNEIDWQAVDCSGLCWIDFSSISEMEVIYPKEIAELLYLKHINHAMKMPFYKNFENQFVFISQDYIDSDKIYFRNWNTFYELLTEYFNEQLNLFINNRSPFNWRSKATLPKIPLAVVKRLAPYIQEGMIFSCAELKLGRLGYELQFWKAAVYQSEIDFFGSFYKDKMKIPSACLVLSKKTNEWGIVGDKFYSYDFKAL